MEEIHKVTWVSEIMGWITYDVKYVSLNFEQKRSMAEEENDMINTEKRESPWMEKGGVKAES